MTYSWKRYALLLLALLGLFSLMAVAQQQTGDLIIKVSDPTGAVIPGAKVTLTSTVMIQPVTGNTDATGVFPARLLKPGIYKVMVEQKGFRPVARDNVVVELGRTYPIDISLPVGATTEVVEVTSGGVAIDTVKSESSEVLRGDKLLSVPGARDFSDFVRLLPGTNNESMLAGISVHGASGAENVFYVDGIDTSDIYGGTNNQGVRTEIVQELQVKTGGYEAEFGGAQGGVISVVTKSGSNDFHGQVYYYNSGSALTSTDRPTLRLKPGVEPAVAEYISYKEDRTIRNELGVNLGGPIWKNKVWFFLNVNPTWNNIKRQAETVDENSLVHEGNYTQNQLRRNGLAKIDAQPFQWLRLFAAYTQDTYRYKGELPSRAGTGSYEYNYTMTGFKYPSYTFNGGFTATITPKILVDSRYGMNGIDTIQFVKPTTPTWYFLNSPAAIGSCDNNFVACPAGSVPDPNFRPGGWYNQYPNTDSYATSQNYQKKLSWNTTGSLTFVAGGQHNLKVGFSYNRRVWDHVDSHVSDYVRPRFGATWTTLTGTKVSGSCVGPSNGLTYNGTTDNNGDGAVDWCGYVEIRSPFGTIAKIATPNSAFFFQDSWTIGRRLTINPGIRFEKEEIPSFSKLPQYSGTVLKWGYTDKIAPRIGASFDLFGNGKAKIYGSWGRFYDVMKLGMAEGSYGGFQWHTQYYLMNQAFVNNFKSVGSMHDPSGFSSNCTQAGVGGKVTCTASANVQGMTFVEDRDWRIPSFDSLDPNLMSMRSNALTFGGEFELWKNYIVSGAYVRKRLDRTIEDVGVQTALGESYYTTNPGFGLSVSEFVAAGMPATPKAKRDYDALELRLRKPFSNNWMADISYTYSKLRGNYSGLASSDEDWGTGGRNDPNVERYFDLWFLNYDAKGKLIDGPLNTDRPHQIKVSGQYQLPHNLPAIGGFFSALSGTPITRAVSFDNAEMYVLNRLSDGRTPFFTQTDVYIVQKFKPFKDESKSIEVNFNISNLFNQKTVLSKNRLMNRSTISLPAGLVDASNLTLVNNFLKNGIDWKAVYDAAVAADPSEKDPRFGMANRFQDPISARIGIRFTF